MDPWLWAAAAFAGGIGSGCIGCFVRLYRERRRREEEIRNLLDAISSDEEVRLHSSSTRSVPTHIEHGRVIQTIRNLGREKRLLTSVLNHLEEGVLILDPPDTIRLVTSPLLAILGVQGGPKEWTGRSLIELSRERKLVTAVEIARSGTRPERISFASGAKNIEVVLHPPGRDGAIFLVWKDITPLARAKRAGEDLVSNVAHQLRTPLTSIKGYAETLLESDMGDPDSSQKFIATILKNADKLSRLVTDILTLARLEGTDMQTAAEKFVWQDLISRTADSLLSEAAKKDVAIETIFPRTPVEALGSKQDLEQAIFNLLDNAVKYAPRETKVTVLLEVRENDALIAVEDRGPGIPMDLADRIFEKFFRIQVKRGQDVPGTGLGLSIVKEIVEAHGGRVWLESRVGLGTTFYALVPLGKKTRDPSKSARVL